MDETRHRPHGGQFVRRGLATDGRGSAVVKASSAILRWVPAYHSNQREPT